MEGADVMVLNEDLLELIPTFDKGGSIWIDGSWWAWMWLRVQIMIWKCVQIFGQMGEVGI